VIEPSNPNRDFESDFLDFLEKQVEKALRYLYIRNIKRLIGPQNKPLYSDNDITKLMNKARDRGGAPGARDLRYPPTLLHWG
jgi:hypothetical protein